MNLQTSLFSNTTNIIHDTDFSATRVTVVNFPYLVYSSDLILCMHMAKNMTAAIPDDRLSLYGGYRLRFTENTFTEFCKEAKFVIELREEDIVIAEFTGMIHLSSDSTITATVKRVVIFKCLDTSGQIIVLNSIEDLTRLFRDILNEGVSGREYTTQIHMLGTLKLPESKLILE